MNVLFYKWNAVNENRVMDALKQLGHNIVISDVKFDNYEIDAALMSSILFSFHENSCDCIFSLNYYPFLSMISETLQKPYIAMVQDSPLFTLYSPCVKCKYTYIFTFDQEECARLISFGASNVKHIALATDPDYFAEKCFKDSKDILNKNSFLYDISFVGSFYNKTDYDKAVGLSDASRGFYDGLMRSQHLIYGASIIESCLNADKSDELMTACSVSAPKDYCLESKFVSAYILERKLTAIERIEYLKMLSLNHKMDIFTGSDKDKTIDANYHGFVSYDDEMPKVFFDSKINLNFTARNIHTGAPLRVFDVLASGGFLITSYQPEIAEIFNHENDLVMFSSEQELEYYVNYYLTHEEQRREIAYNGYKKVCEKYRYTIVIEEMLEMVCK